MARLLVINLQHGLAFFHALSAAEKYDDDIDISIVTDASYVCFVDFAIRSGIPDFPNHKVRNGDIIGMIRRHSQELKCSKPKVADPSRIPRTGTIFGHFTVTLMLVLLLLLRPLSRMSRRLSLTCFRVWPVFKKKPTAPRQFFRPGGPKSV